MFRFGILSTAKIAREHLIPAMLQSETAIVAGIAARERTRAEAVATQFQIPMVFDSYDALLASDDIDGVYIPIHNTAHVEWSIRAAQAGKHVLCEKPIAMRAADIASLIAAREATGKLISEAFMVTHHPQWHKVRDLLANGAVGQLRHVQASFSFFNDDADNTRNKTETGGGAIPDIGVYPMITTRFATGAEPKRVRSQIEFDPASNVDVFANVTAEFEGFSQNFYVSTRLALQQSISFHGDKGRIWLAAPFNAGLFDADKVFWYRDADQATTEFKFRGVNQYASQIDAFTAACADRSKPHVTLENSLANQTAIDAIYAANASGGWADVAPTDTA